MAEGMPVAAIDTTVTRIKEILKKAKTPEEELSRKATIKAAKEATRKMLEALEKVPEEKSGNCWGPIRDSEWDAAGAGGRQQCTVHSDGSSEMDVHVCVIFTNGQEECSRLSPGDRADFRAPTMYTHCSDVVVTGLDSEWEKMAYGTVTW